MTRDGRAHERSPARRGFNDVANLMAAGHWMTDAAWSGLPGGTR